MKSMLDTRLMASLSTGHLDRVALGGRLAQCC